MDGMSRGKVGTNHTRSGNSNTLKGSVPKGQSKVGTGTVRETHSPSNTGRVIDGQNLRGYVSRNSSLPTPKDATVSTDGRRRVRKV